nr:hypothetical protein [Mesorhizobium sp.]
MQTMKRAYEKPILMRSTILLQSVTAQNMSEIPATTDGSGGAG